MDVLDEIPFRVFYSNFAIRRPLKLDVPVSLGGFGSFPVGRRRLFPLSVNNGFTGTNLHIL